jgi:hypothetical protein
LEYAGLVWITALEEHGIAVLPLDSEHVRLTDHDDSEVFFVLTVPRLVRTHDAKPAPERHALLVAPSITSEALERAWAAGWSVVTDDGTGRLRLAQRTVLLDGAQSVPPPQRRPGRPARSVFSVVRALFALEGGVRQDEIAEFAHVGQAAVSKAMNRLVEQGLVARGQAGWQITDRAGAISWWLAHYPGPGGIETHWFGVDPINEQAYRVYLALGEERANPIISGDVAADLVAPWRTPRRATLYARRGIDFSAIGLTPSEASASTLTLVLPDDHSMWPISKAPVLVEMRGHGDVARANAFQVLYDLARAPGPDAGEALEAWRTWMIESGAVL